MDLKCRLYMKKHIHDYEKVLIVESPTRTIAADLISAISKLKNCKSIGHD